MPGLGAKHESPGPKGIALPEKEPEKPTMGHGPSRAWEPMRTSSGALAVGELCCVSLLCCASYMVEVLDDVNGMHRAVPFVVRGLRWHAPAVPSPPRRPERSAGPAPARVDGARTCDTMARHYGGRVVGGMSAARRKAKAAHRTGRFGRIVGIVGDGDAGQLGADHVRVPVTTLTRHRCGRGPRRRTRGWRARAWCRAAR